MTKLLFLPCALVLLGGALSANAAPRADDTVSVATLLREETDFSRLPLRRNWTVHLNSSCDPTGGNKDAQQFISWEGKTALLADLKGPGALVRFWSTTVAKVGKSLSAFQTGILKIYIDDNPVPVIDMPFGDLFKGKFGPFVPPLTALNACASFTYLPIPYAKHCRITVDEPKELFYQINSLRFPDGTKVRPFAMPLAAEDEAALSLASAKWSLPDVKTSGTSASTANAKLEIEAGASTELPAIAGPATVTGLVLSAPGVSDSGLRKLVLRAWFDGHKTPDIEAPVADFFGNAYGHKVFKSLYFSQDAMGEMTFRLPMPFSSGARFSIENGNSKPVALNVSLATQPGPIPEGSLYLRADFNQEITVKGKAHLWAHVEDQGGHFVGVVQTMQGGRTLGYCEGDDQVRVDDEKFLPSKFATVVAPWNGTGTEDCFNSAWYFSEGEKALPMNGCLIKQGFGRIDTFRFFLNDAPVFQHSLDAQIEHGGENDTQDEYYSSVAFWYGTGERTQIIPMPAAATLGFPKVAFQGLPTIIEGESLVGIAKVTGGAIREHEMSGLQNVWSGERELLWTGGKTGDSITLPFTAPVAGDYKIIAYYTRGPGNGIFTAAVNGIAFKNSFNAYSETFLNVGPSDLGVITLPAGKSELTITLCQKDGRSAGNDFGLDLFGLRPAPKPKPEAP